MISYLLIHCLDIGMPYLLNSYRRLSKFFFMGV